MHASVIFTNKDSYRYFTFYILTCFLSCDFLISLCVQEQPGAPDQVQPTPQVPPSRNGLRSQSMISRTPAQEELPPSRPSAVKKDNKSRIAKPTQPSRMEKEEMPPPAVPSEERLRQAIGAPLVKEPAAKDISLVAGKRKSSCVKEVEKMQKKREERRLVDSNSVYVCACMHVCA